MEQLDLFLDPEDLPTPAWRVFDEALRRDVIERLARLMEKAALVPAAKEVDDHER
jgi:hypothetical protein